MSPPGRPSPGRCSLPDHRIRPGEEQTQKDHCYDPTRGRPGPHRRGIARVDQALDALVQILRAGEQTVTVDGIAHELRGLAESLRSLRDDVAAEDDRAK
jgi:hypothetical protein